MKILFNCFLFFSFFCYAPKAIAQQLNIDSLLKEIAAQKDDTTKVKTLRNLSIAYKGVENGLGKKYLQESFSLATRLNYKKGIINAYLSMGEYKEGEEKLAEAFDFYNKAFTLANEEGYKKIAAGALTKKGILHRLRGEYQQALECYNAALKIDEEQKEKKYIARDYGNISVVYWNQGNYSKAIEYDFKILRLFEELKDQNGIATTLGNLGSVYASQGDNKKALEYYLKSLEIEKAQKNIPGVARCYANVGVLYANKKEYDKALEYYNNALSIYEVLKNKSGVANCLGNMGLVYELKGTDLTKNNSGNKPDSLYDKALECYFKALKMDEEIQDSRAIAAKLGYIGALYTTEKKYKPAETYLLKALDLSYKIGAVDLRRDNEDFLQLLYSEMGNEKKAFMHYKQMIMLKDSLSNEEQNKEQARYELNYEFDKKEAALKAEQEKKDVITKAESKKQRLILLFISLVLILVFIFSIFILRSLRITRKQKQLIEIKNKETEAQKAVIEEKQAEILQSIHYAKRIQQSLLPTEKYIARNLTALNKKP